MITLYSYPGMFGLPDNNPFGLKVEAFLRLAKFKYKIEHVVDTQNAPRKQLPYIVDGEKVISDSNQIISYLIEQYNLTTDIDLSEPQKNIHFLLNRMLDYHLYWVISYSRWNDERYWSLFKAEFLKQLPNLDESILNNAKKYNQEKYYMQGISRYSIDEVYQSGIDDLKSIKHLVGEGPYIFGEKVHSVDACCYGFLANIYYFDIDTPLKEYIHSNVSLEQYIQQINNLLYR